MTYLIMLLITAVAFVAGLAVTIQQITLNGSTSWQALRRRQDLSSRSSTRRHPLTPPAGRRSGIDRAVVHPHPDDQPPGSGQQAITSHLEPDQRCLVVSRASDCTSSRVLWSPVKAQFLATDVELPHMHGRLPSRP